MRHPQLVIYEDDGNLASLLEPMAKESGWLIRESRQPENCLKLLQKVRPGVLVLKLRDFVREFELLARVHRRLPDLPVAVVSDVKLESVEQRLNLAGLAYDLGASYAMFPPIEPGLVEDLVAGLMAAAISRCGGGVDES